MPTRERARFWCAPDVYPGEGGAERVGSIYQIEPGCGLGGMILATSSTAADGAAVQTGSGIWNRQRAVPARRPHQRFEGIDRTSELHELFSHIETQLGCVSTLPVFAAPLQISPNRDGALFGARLHWR